MVSKSSFSNNLVRIYGAASSDTARMLQPHISTALRLQLMFTTVQRHLWIPRTRKGSYWIVQYQYPLSRSFHCKRSWISSKVHYLIGNSLETKFVYWSFHREPSMTQSVAGSSTSHWANALPTKLCHILGGILPKHRQSHLMGRHVLLQEIWNLPYGICDAERVRGYFGSMQSVSISLVSTNEVLRSCGWRVYINRRCEWLFGLGSMHLTPRTRLTQLFV